MLQLRRRGYYSSVWVSNQLTLLTQLLNEILLGNIHWTRWSFHFGTEKNKTWGTCIWENNDYSLFDPIDETHCDLCSCESTFSSSRFNVKLIFQFGVKDQSKKRYLWKCMVCMNVKLKNIFQKEKEF